jgi:queuine tRNA-ribosyltransferase
MSGSRFAFSVSAADGAARAGTVSMIRVVILTDAFMAVCTDASVLAM